MKATCYPDEIMTDMPYPIYPKGLYDAIMDVATLGVPVYITENGIADQKDDRRDLFLRSYISAMFDAIRDGVDVRGYYYWTFTDNFEWGSGFSKKFGLIKVDYKTKKRYLRPSALIMKEITKHNGIPEELEWLGEDKF
jgi:beta-glucosidase/6-phospho-beta-glucosidase/beta-galactosidase